MSLGCYIQWNIMAARRRMNASFSQLWRLFLEMNWSDRFPANSPCYMKLLLAIVSTIFSRKGCFLFNKFLYDNNKKKMSIPTFYSLHSQLNYDPLKSTKRARLTEKRNRESIESFFKLKKAQPSTKDEIILSPTSPTNKQFY